MTDWRPMASKNISDAFAISRSVVMNAAGSNARAEIGKAEEKTLPSEAEARSINLETERSARCDSKSPHTAKWPLLVYTPYPEPRDVDGCP